MCPDTLQRAQGMDDSGATDVEVVACPSEAPSDVISLQRFDGVGMISACRTAVYDDVADV